MGDTAEIVAHDVFQEALRNSDKKTAPLLEEAIDKLGVITGTPVFDGNKSPMLAI